MLLLEEIKTELLLQKNWTKARQKYRFGSKKNNVQDKMNRLIECYNQTFHTDVLEAENLYATMKETVKSCTSNKDALIEFYKRLEKYLNDTYGLKLHCTFPPIEISNTFERLMYLAKEFQMTDKTLADLEEELWISSRTINSDYQRLIGNDEENTLQVCGRRFIVDGVRRRKGRLEFDSTVHPLFLTYNISQVIVTLKGLQQISSDQVMGTYAYGSAVSIWQQLSKYAKERILYVTSCILPEEYEWFKKLDEYVSSEEAGHKYLNSYFLTERQYSEMLTDGSAVLMEAMKSGESFMMEYLEEDGGTKFYLNCSIDLQEPKDETIIIKIEGKSRVFDLNRIIRSAYSKEALI